MPMARNATLLPHSICELVIQSYLDQMLKYDQETAYRSPIFRLVPWCTISRLKKGEAASWCGLLVQLRSSWQKKAIMPRSGCPQVKFALFGRSVMPQLGRLAIWITAISSLVKLDVSAIMGIRPTVRGTAMSPRDHPHGGGEGRQPIGMPSPKEPLGKTDPGCKNPAKQEDRSSISFAGVPRNAKVRNNALRILYERYVGDKTMGRSLKKGPFIERQLLREN